MNAHTWRDGKILITGGTGMVGRSLHQRLSREGLDVVAVGFQNDDAIKIDLRSQKACHDLFSLVKPHTVFHLAAKVGGVYANLHNKASFYLANAQINTNVIGEIQERNIPFVFAAGTGCAYPKKHEGTLLTENKYLDGPPEQSNDAYAYTKRDLLIHLKAIAESRPDFRFYYGLFANLYGPYDNFHPTDSHVTPSLIRKFYGAKMKHLPQVSIWGNGQATRDFLFVEDLVDAILILVDSTHANKPVNIVTAVNTTIADLAETIKDIVGYDGNIVFDTSYPQGQYERLFDNAIMSQLGWRPRHSLTEGLTQTINWYTQAISYREDIRQSA